MGFVLVLAWKQNKYKHSRFGPNNHTFGIWVVLLLEASGGVSVLCDGPISSLSSTSSTVTRDFFEPDGAVRAFGDPRESERSFLFFCFTESVFVRVWCAALLRLGTVLAGRDSAIWR